MTTNQYIRFAVMGIHGYSRSHIGDLQRLERAGGSVKLVAAVAHVRRQDEAYASSLETTGVRLVSDVDSLLAMKNDIDVVTVPVGIALHVPMAEKALRAGYAVYLEKPVTGAIQDLDHLAEVEQQVPGPLFIGFQDIFQPGLWELKRRILKGDLGPLRRAVVMSAGPRAQSYYERADWAGRLSVNGTWVLDSPLNNACAHYINLVLFLAGTSLSVAARPLEVTAELYHAHPIESADTTAVRVRTHEGVEIVFIASHACKTQRGSLVRLEFDAGEVTGNPGAADAAWQLHPASGISDRIEIMKVEVDPFASVARVIRNEKDVLVCTLAMARPHTLVVNGAHFSSPIRDIPAALCATESRVKNNQTQTYTWVKDMNACLDVCFEKGCLPSESGVVQWAQPGQPVNVSRLTVFSLPK